MTDCIYLSTEANVSESVMENKSVIENENDEIYDNAARIIQAYVKRGNNENKSIERFITKRTNVFFADFYTDPWGPLIIKLFGKVKGTDVFKYWAHILVSRPITVCAIPGDIWETRLTDGTVLHTITLRYDVRINAYTAKMRNRKRIQLYNTTPEKEEDQARRRGFCV